MTAKEIQRRLMVERYRRSFVLPNYTPSGWFEVDLFELSKAGYFREYEIKISRGDFFADATKAREEFPRPYGSPSIFHNKHKLLESKDVTGPVQFWFVTPKGLLTPDEVPAWAGLIEALPTQRKEPYSVVLTETKAAPRLHNQKASPKIKEHAQSVTYWRMHGLLLG